ncbi:hypothetical protein [Microtetraspora malaysiensis]|uniref:Lipoprotein n=1 Tax=Microtetraspora malaysiensis TaxID=161358 RepID=A0ABW6SIK5_9ACTN
MLALTACAQDPSVINAREQADEVAQKLTRYLAWVPEDVGYSLTRDKRVEVFDVSGTKFSLDNPGRVLIRVHGKGWKYETFIFVAGTPTPEVVMCFEITVSYSDADVDEVDCPAGRPGTFRPPPRLPAAAFEQLKKHLPRKLDLVAAERVVLGLDLDPRIREDVRQINGVIGVAVREGPGSCLFARVKPPEVEVWHPSPIQVMPGEGECSAAEAANGYAQRPPH